jgi:DNA-binding transcriptional LysR family regulator
MQIAPMFDWGDLRHFLAVARGGSTLAAAKALCVNQTTVARRIAAMEEALGERLFDRLSGGYRLTELGAAMVGHAERVEAEVEAFCQEVVQRGRRLAGVIRVTTNEVFAETLLAPCLAEFTDLFPEVQLEIVINERRLDIGRGEADIAIRAAILPTEGDGAVSRRLARGRWGVYCGKVYAAETAKPVAISDLIAHPLVMLTGHPAAMEPEFLKRLRAEGAQIRSSSSSLLHIASAIRAGLGVGALPCVLGRLDPHLEECFLFPDGDYDLLLIVREDIRHLRHVRAFNDFIAARTSVLRYIIEGRDP